MYIINTAAAKAKLAKADPNGQPALILNLWLANPTMTERKQIRQAIEASGKLLTVQSAERVLAYYLNEWRKQGVVTSTDDQQQQPEQELRDDWRQLAEEQAEVQAAEQTAGISYRP